ncbi:AI-2E family transporter [archaeon]|jgi:predicted PurR-regulated permease PerM|nr:AI-2E family transporter [archaeon]
MEVKITNYKHILILGGLIAMLFMAYRIVAQFIPALFIAAILAIIFYPIFNRINSKVKRRGISAAITMFLIFMLVSIPLLFMTGPIIRETSALQQSIASFDFDGVSNTIQEFTNIEVNLGLYVKDYTSKLSGFLINATANIFLSIMRGFLQIFVIAFTMFYLFMQGPKVLKHLKKILPLARESKNKLFKDVQDTTNGIIFGLVLSGIAQGVAGSIGLWLAGVPNAIFWGMIITILAILPAIGASAIWIPASVYLLSVNRIIPAVLLFLYGFFFISSIENIMKPRWIGKKAKIHPIVILLGLLGGLSMFGFAGILIGPLVLSLVVVTYRVLDEKHEI